MKQQERDAIVADKAWHAKPIDEVANLLRTDLHRGLSAEEADRRLASLGRNELQTEPPVSPWSILLGQFKNVLIIILLIATALSAVLGHAVEAIAIAVIVLFAVLLGFVQEYRAERAIEKLRQMAALSAVAVRGGHELEVPTAEIVPGDLLLLTAGNKVPADARIVESVNLRADEAPLTGESTPVEKQVQALAVDLSIGDRINLLYAGTVVVYGRGRAVVVETGMQTQFGKIAGMLQSVQSMQTPLQQNLDRVGRNLATAALGIVTLIVALGLFRGQPFLEMFIFGIALAIAVVPEALPAVVTISLAIGVQRMIARNTLVRRLPAVETLGTTSVICSDKTGTLTRDEMTVRKLFLAGESIEVGGSGYEPVGEFRCADRALTPAESPALVELARAGVLASDARLHKSEEDRWTIKGDPTEGALVVLAAKAGIDKAELDRNSPRVHEAPFTSESKRMTTIAEINNRRVAFSKGAPEIILASCRSLIVAAGERELDEAARRSILEAAHEFASSAHRVLGVARKLDAQPESAEIDMTFVGLVGMIDPPRAEARSAVQTCKEAGVKVVMITGDHPITARSIAAELGILGSEGDSNNRVVTGADLDQLSDEQLAGRVADIDVYARVSPAHKLRVVDCLQRQGHIVAMTGDGVNDAPALRKADIGIAMGISGTDVTKEACDVMLTDDNFASIVAAVEEGRGIFANIKKYLMYLLSANIGEIGILTGASLLGWPLPLTAVQLLYVNLATDGLPALALAVDPPERNLMNKPPRNPRQSIFTRSVTTLMLVGGWWATTSILTLYGWSLWSGQSEAEAMTLTFVAMVLLEFFKAYNFRSERDSAFKRPFSNHWLNLAILWEILLLIAIVYVPFLQRPFKTFALTSTDWLLALACAATLFPVMEITKFLLRKFDHSAP